MGWTSTQSWKNSTNQEIIEDELGYGFEILQIETKKERRLGYVENICSLAIRTKDTGRIWGCVALIERKSGEVSLKLIDETCGPCEARASKKLIGMLSPLADPDDKDLWAARWRHRCLNKV